MKYHITAVKVDPSINKQTGERNMTKSGKPCFSVGIKTAELGDVWLNNNFMPFEPKGWENSEQDLEVIDREYNGKIYKNFKLMPREEKTTEGTGKIAFSITHLHQKIDHLQEDISNIRKFLMEGKKIPQELSGRDYPTAEQEGINPAKAGMKSEDDSFEEIATPEGW